MTSRRLNAHRWPVDRALRGETGARDRFGHKVAAPSPWRRPPASVPRSRRDYALIGANAAFVSAANVANLGFEDVGLDLAVLAKLL